MKADKLKLEKSRNSVKKNTIGVCVAVIRARRIIGKRLKGFGFCIYILEYCLVVTKE